MKLKDLVFFGIFVLIFAPFFLFPEAYAWFNTTTKEHGFLMSFVKFAILATMGESLGLRIKTGKYNFKGFGLFPRALVWGFLGLFIFIAFKVFASGVPVFLEYMGLEGSAASMKAGFSSTQLITAFFISFFMNLIFAPIMMTFHKITDTHIEQNGGRVTSLFKCIPMGSILGNINWNVQWSFVFKRTIPFFWIPAHTITFLLPEEFRVLFAAVLGIALGVILAIASQMNKK
ncbi:MAG: hypothetical protein CVU11_11200 [Bacteroidetes bacterium HGW-Bacteroidetes-6]|jgi:hypothetical protein|nr:MAG: hypothetical protein CVU11_11200 [Bacteroidetes bacterium HGW-Bacteroidetes-6]